MLGLGNSSCREDLGVSPFQEWLQTWHWDPLSSALGMTQAKRTHCGCLLRSIKERALWVDLLDLLCIFHPFVGVYFTFLDFFGVDCCGFSCSPQPLWLACLYPMGSSWGGSWSREKKRIVQCKTRLRAGRIWDREGQRGDKGQEGHQNRGLALLGCAFVAASQNRPRQHVQSLGSAWAEHP